MKLYELTETMQDLEQMLESTEIDEEMYNNSLELVNYEISQKSTSLFKLLKVLDYKSDTITNEIRRLQAYKKFNESKMQKLKDYIKLNMQNMNLKKIEFDLGSFSLRNSSSVEILNLDKIPSKYKTVEYIEKVNKNELKQEIKAGIEISGAVLKQNQNLIVK